MKYQDFVDQLQKLKLSNATIDNDVLLVEFKPVGEHRVDGRLIILVQAVIRYSTVYNEPELLVRCWTCCEEDGIEVVEPIYTVDISTVLGIPSEFVVELDVNINDEYSSKILGPWYSVHPCDTAEIIGKQYMDKYLERWVSVFLCWVDGF